MGTIIGLKSRVAIFLMKIQEYYNELKPFYTSKSKFCFIGVMALIMVPPLVLALSQFLILYFIPQQFTLDYLHLDYYQPNISSMFFSAYIHNASSFDHLLGNYAGYVVVISLILVFFFVIIPLLKVHNKLSLSYSDRSLFLTAAVFFFILPFSLAGISIVLGKIIGQSGTWGFSGILWAFAAYFTFLMITMLYDATLTKSILNIKTKKESVEIPDEDEIQSSEKMNMRALLFMLISTFLIVAPVIVILLDIGNEKINVVAHLGGFILGLFVSIIIALICESRNKRVRAFFVVFLGLILLIPAISWIFL